VYVAPPKQGPRSACTDWRSIPRWNSPQATPACPPRRSDGLMRSELEGRLMFAAPSELLIATPLSQYSERLLVRARMRIP